MECSKLVCEDLVGSEDVVGIEDVVRSEEVVPIVQNPRKKFQLEIQGVDT